MSLAMTDGEICESYRSAKDQKKQLNTLAQLNATNKETIARILREGGYKVDGRWLVDRKRYKPKKAAPVEDPVPPPQLEEMPSAPEEAPMWDDAPVGADALGGPSEEPEEVMAAPCHPERSEGSLPAEDPEPVTVEDLWQALGDLPADAQLLINGLPFGAIHYFKRAAPGGWDETVDLTGQPRTYKELLSELEDT